MTSASCSGRDYSGYVLAFGQGWTIQVLDEAPKLETIDRERSTPDTWGLRTSNSEKKQTHLSSLRAGAEAGLRYRERLACLTARADTDLRRRRSGATTPNHHGLHDHTRCEHYRKRVFCFGALLTPIVPSAVASEKLC